MAHRATKVNERAEGLLHVCLQVLARSPTDACSDKKLLHVISSVIAL